MSSTAQPESTEPLSAALLLAATGGLLDAFVYLNHGHVFANAMTGNVVLLGIALVGHHGFQAIRHLAPLGAFFLGVATSRFVRDRLGRRASPYGLSLEITVLFLASLLPGGFPEMAFTGLIAFVASYQITSFRRVGGLSYSSTFVTGNLRDMAVGLYDAIGPLGPKPDLELRRISLRNARALGLICFCFLAGASAGAFCAPRLANHTLLIAEPLLLAVLVGLYRRPAASASA
jgi:uncharacterized membrane protein YoaK (UPF0700 family)